MYYVYIGENVQGPFSLGTIEENLNGGVWTPELLCCKAGSDDWQPLNSLFHVKFIPPEETLSTAERVLRRTQRFVMNAIRSNPFQKNYPSPQAPPATMAEALNQLEKRGAADPSPPATGPMTVTPSVIISHNHSLLKPGETLSTIRIIPKDNQKLKPWHYLVIAGCVMLAVFVFFLFLDFLNLVSLTGK